MFTLETIINPTCSAFSVIPASNSIIPSALKVILSSEIFKQLSSSTYVLILLSIALLCFTFYSLATEFSETRAASAANKVEDASTSHLQDLTDSDLNLSYSDDYLMNEIELELLPVTECSSNTGDNDENSAVCEAQSPKLMIITPIMIIEEDFKDDPLEPAVQEQQEQDQVTPAALEWFLQKDISPEDLDRLNYSQRARRFYHLKTFGEVIVVEEKPPEEQKKQQAEEELQVVPYDHQAERFDAQLDFIQQEGDTITDVYDVGAFDDDDVDANVAIAKQLKECQHYYQPPPPLLQNYLIPMNLLSDLVEQAERIDIPQFQMSSLKMNCIFNSSFLADQKYQFIQSQLNGAVVVDKWKPPLPLSNFNNLQLKYLSQAQVLGLELANKQYFTYQNMGDMNVAFAIMKLFVSFKANQRSKYHRIILEY